MKQYNVRGHTWSLDLETWVTRGSNLIPLSFYLFTLNSDDFGGENLKHVD